MFSFRYERKTLHVVDNPCNQLGLGFEPWLTGEKIYALYSLILTTKTSVLRSLQISMKMVLFFCKGTLSNYFYSDLKAVKKLGPGGRGLYKSVLITA